MSQSCWKLGDVVKASKFMFNGVFHYDIWFVVTHVQIEFTGTTYEVRLLFPHDKIEPAGGLIYNKHDVGRKVPPSRWPNKVCVAMAKLILLEDLTK